MKQQGGKNAVTQHVCESKTSASLNVLHLLLNTESPGREDKHFL